MTTHLHRALIGSALGVAAALSALWPWSPAAAFNCAIPALISPSKKMVCATPSLRLLDNREKVGRHQLLGKLGIAARPAIMSSYNGFKATRDGCGSDQRCLQASYRAQLRLYARVNGCAAKSDPLQCVSRTIERHRQELHRSM